MDLSMVPSLRTSSQPTAPGSAAQSSSRQPGQGELLFDGRATGLTWYTFVDHLYQYLTNLALSKEYHSLGFVPVSSKLLVLKACMPADSPAGQTLNQLMRAPDFYIPTTQDVVESEPVADVASTLARVAIAQDHALNGTSAATTAVTAAATAAAAAAVHHPGVTTPTSAGISLAPPTLAAPGQSTTTTTNIRPRQRYCCATDE
jgi:hypothetical protein